MTLRVLLWMARGRWQDQVSTGAAVLGLAFGGENVGSPDALNPYRPKPTKTGEAVEAESERGWAAIFAAFGGVPAAAPVVPKEG